MELKNAGFENTEVDRQKARHRMIDGEEFHFSEYTIKFDGNSFVFIRSGHQPYSEAYIWSHIYLWQVEVDWKAELSPENPRWCKVSHEGKWSFHLIIRIDSEELYFSDYGLCLWDAIPVSDELAALLDAELING